MQGSSCCWTLTKRKRNVITFDDQWKKNHLIKQKTTARNDYRCEGRAVEYAQEPQENKETLVQV